MKNWFVSQASRILYFEILIALTTLGDLFQHTTLHNPLIWVFRMLLAFCCAAWAAYIPENFAWVSVLIGNRLSVFRNILVILSIEVFSYFIIRSLISLLHSPDAFHSPIIVALTDSIIYPILFTIIFTDNDSEGRKRARLEASDKIRELVARVTAVHGQSLAPIRVK